MNTDQLKFRDKYIKATQAIQELVDCDKTIQGVNVIFTANRNIIIALDLWATPTDENIYTKVHDFIPDFELEKHIEE
jgi:hypothetical protein